MVKQTRQKSKVRKRDVWFVAVRGSYLPSSAFGWLTYLPFVAYLLFSGIVGFRNTDSAALAILFIVPNWVAATAVMTYVAARRS